MTLFLFLKQLVDVFYKFRILDYLMVCLVLVMLVYQVILVRPNIRKHFTVTDGIILILSVLFSISFIRDIHGYGTYFKVISAFLMYFMGRIYYDRIQESYGALAAGGYVVVYLNFFNRILKFGVAMTAITNANGDLYYYDTDMAFAMILAMTFIMMFAHNTVFKMVTVFIICPYMVFQSDAGIQKVLMLAVYAIVVMYIMELLVENIRIANILLTVMVVGLLTVVIIIYLPVIGIANDDIIVSLFGGRFLDNDNMYGRYEVWKSVLEEFKHRSLLGQCFGTDIGANINMGSLYMKILYTLGYSGILLSIVFIFNVVYYVVKVYDRKNFYVAVILMVMLLGTGVTVSSMESTQMSWFPMLFIGMVVSSVQAQRKQEEA